MKLNASHLKDPGQLLQLLPSQTFCDLLQVAGVTGASWQRLTETRETPGILPWRVLPVQLQIGSWVPDEGWKAFQRPLLVCGP